MLDNRYEIVEEIGRGGTGIVFLAYHHGLRKYVVVKKLKESFGSRPDIRVEVDILKNLHHPFLPQVYDFIQYGDQIYTVMDYVEGCDLESYREQGYRFSEKQLVYWLRQLLQVLEYLHSQIPPIIHSDIKPANIMIDQKGDVCLIDFNISIGSENALILGLSRRYASPEQIELYQILTGTREGKWYSLDVRTDLYSLGLTFYELMTGVAPNVNRDENPPLFRMQTGYSTAFCNVIQKAMQESRERRYRSAGKMLRALERMEKHPSRKLRIADWAATGLWALGLTTACWLYACGTGEEHKAAYQAACIQLEAAYQLYDSELVREQGEHILSEKDWKSCMEQDEGRQGDILHAVGDAWFWEEEYGKAADYYKMAIEAGGNDEAEKLYYRDAAIALARNKDLAGAEAMLGQAQLTGVSGQELLLIKGELELNKQDYAEAEKCFEELLRVTEDTAENMEISSRAYEGLAFVYSETGNTEKEVQNLRKLCEMQDNILNLRKLGAALSEYASKAEKKEEALSLNREAKRCYDKILSMDICTVEDRLNYAVICQNCGEYAEGLAVLQALSEEEPDNYEISKQICYLLYRMELGKPESDRNYEMMLDYYRLAWRQYDTREITGERDEEMLVLKQIVDVLEGSGRK